MNALALAGAGVSVQCDWIDTKKGASMKVWIKPLSNYRYAKGLAKEEHPSLIPETVSPHGLRHSKSMHMLQAGVPLIYIRDFLGHSEISTTEIYARYDSEQKRKAIEAACLNITVRQVAQRAPE